MNKSKVITLEELNIWLNKNRELVVLGSTDGKADWNLKMNYKNKPYKCGCGETHKFIPDFTKIWWKRKLTAGKMILQEPTCTFICYIEMKGIFKVEFETIYSANKFSSNEKKDYENFLNFISTINNGK